MQPCRSKLSPEQIIAIGQQGAAQVYDRMPVASDDSPLSRYVSDLGQKLAANAPGNRWQYNFHVVNAAEVNAFAMPGGTVFVTTGLVQAAVGETQLAGVLAHEIAHAALQHMVCNLGAAQAPDAPAGLNFLRMTRGAEQEADMAAVGILYDAGYDPRGMSQFFEGIQAKYRNGGAGLVLDHPNPGNRSLFVSNELETYAERNDYASNSAGFAQAQQAADAMKPYTEAQVESGAWKRQDQGQNQGQSQSQNQNQAQSQNQNQAQAPGATDDIAAAVASGSPQTAAPQASVPQSVAQQTAVSQAPAVPVDSPQAASPNVVRTSAGGGDANAEQWTTFSGDGFSIDIPADWQAGGDKKAAMLAPQGGVTAGQNGTTNLSFGVLTDLYQPPQQGNAQEVFAALMQDIRKQNPTLQPDDGGAQEVPLGGASAEMVHGVDQKSGNGDAEHTWIVGVLQQNGAMRYFVFVAPSKEVFASRKTFQRMIQSIKLQ
jgi:hypothetical protein